MKTLENTTQKLNKSQNLILDKLESMGFEFSQTFEIVQALKFEDIIYKATQTFNIAPETLGLFAPAIKNMKAEVTAMFDLSSKKIVIKYSYNHPCGSNGYSVTLTNNSNSEFEWVDRSF